MSDLFGGRMKFYESVESGRRFDKGLPVCVRLDGKGFSKFTRHMARPYDERLSKLMQDVTVRLIEETNACVGYTQSDEISLAYWSESPSLIFDGRVQKLTSVLASMCTAWFNEQYAIRFGDGRLAFFDCRAWQPPSFDEAANVFLWREFDATKNSVSMAARTCFSHAELQDKNSGEMIEMLGSKGIFWSDYPEFFKRGSWFRRNRIIRAFTSEELERLPEKHEARLNPDLKVERTEVSRLQLPAFVTVSNRVDVLFHGASPITG